MEQILRHLLLDGAALLIPTLRGIKHALHSQRLDVQRHVDVLGRHGEQVLRDALARIGIEVTAHDGADIGELLGAKAGAAPEHHVLLRVRHAREARGCLIRAHQIIDRGRDHRRQGVAHDDDAQAIRQCRAQHVWLSRAGGCCGCRGRGCSRGGDGRRRQQRTCGAGEQSTARNQCGEDHVVFRVGGSAMITDRCRPPGARV